MRLTALTAFVCLAPATSAFARSGNTVEMAGITVRLVNTSRATERQVSRAAQEVGWVFSKAGIKVEWVHCSSDPRDHPDDRCAESAKTFVIGITDDRPDFLSEKGLGFALVKSGNRNHGAVLYPRIVALAKAQPMLGGIDHAFALAIAHELGHLILGSTDHSSSGLLRSTCGPAEFHAFAQRRLTFAPTDVARMRARVAELR
jgi:hypothetical protein